MIITISGTAGSGKSTVAKMLAEKLDAERIYVGGIRRELARKKGMTIEQLNEYAKTNPETDVDVDKEASQQARELEKSGKIVVVEGRPQFHFIPESIKIFVKADIEEAAKRIWKDLHDKSANKQRNEDQIETIEELKQKIKKRDESDAQRYLKYYNVDHREEKNYDYILDTSELNAEQALEKVLQFIESRKD